MKPMRTHAGLRKTAPRCDSAKIPEQHSRGTLPQRLYCKARSESFFRYPPAICSGRKLQNASSILDRKSTRLNSSHTVISYAVFCLKKKKQALAAAAALDETAKFTTTARTYT